MEASRAAWRCVLDSFTVVQLHHVFLDHLGDNKIGDKGAKALAAGVAASGSLAQSCS